MPTPKKLFLVAGARPNFMKIAPIVRELARHRDHFDCKIVHTGQHYDREMSDVFFEELEIPKPDFHLEVGSGSHAEQSARVMTRFEKICQEERPDLVMVAQTLRYCAPPATGDARPKRGMRGRPADSW